MGEINSNNLQLSYSRPPMSSQSHPWLVFCHGNRKQRQTFYSISESRYYVKIVPEMRNKVICYSCYGWLLLKDLDTHNYSFINPRSMKNIQLPQTHLRIKSYIPLCHPDKPESLFFFLCEGNVFLIWLHTESEFAKHDIELEDEDDKIEAAVRYEKGVYGLTCYGMKLVVMKDYKSLSPIQFENSIIEESLRQYVRHPSLPFKTYMVTSGDELMVVVQTYSHLSYIYYSCGRVLDFQIFRADFTKRTWEELSNIGNQTIFVSSDEEYDKCCHIIKNESENGIKSDSIYFSEWTRLYIYNLKDRSISMSLPCPAVSKYYYFQCWVEF